MLGACRTICNGGFGRLIYINCKNVLLKRSQISVQSARFSSSTRPTSATTKCAKLTNRNLIRISGRDAGILLQGLITNDICCLTRDTPVIYTMLLNQQGRVLYDAIIYATYTEAESEPVYLMECEEMVAPELLKHVKMFKIRKKADLANVSSDYDVWAAFDTNGKISLPGSTGHNAICVADPRLPTFGRRLVVPKNTNIPDILPGLSEANIDAYTTYRYMHGISEGCKDLPVGNALPLESNLDYMNGVSFHKGCYLGQELTARTHHTGVIRKRLMPVVLSNYQKSVIINSNEKVSTKDGKNAGKFRSHVEMYGLALLRIVYAQNVLTVDVEGGSTVELRASVPEWWPHKTLDSIPKLHSE